MTRPAGTALSDDDVIWLLDRDNASQLESWLARAHSRGTSRMAVVLEAKDLTDDQTEVADEGLLVPPLRRAIAKAPAGLTVELRLSAGRRYRLPPPSLDLSTNDLCGLECVMCANRNSERDPETLPPDTVRDLIRQAASWGIGRVALTGAGEPFRDPELLGHMEFAHRLGLLATVTTNGLPVTDEVAARLALLRCSVSVSIHGATDETHEAITGVRGSGAGAWRAIRRLAAARDTSAGRGKMSVNVSTVLQRRNVGELLELVTRSRREGANGHNLQPLNLQHGTLRDGHAVRRDDEPLMAALWPLAEQAAELDALFDELIAFKERHGHINTPVERLRLFRRYFADSSRESLGVSCRVGDSFLGVNHTGKIRPCYRLPWEVGNARLLSVRRLWNSKAYERVREIVDTCPLTCMNNCFFRS